MGGMVKHKSVGGRPEAASVHKEEKRGKKVAMEPGIPGFGD